jgi:hypothetical protein
MVKLGFIVEGATEKVILEKSDFFSHLDSLSIAYVSEVIDVNGNENLLPNNIEEHTITLREKGANRIFILTDLDKGKCITSTKKRIDAGQEQTVIISVKQIESWFLADTEAMRSFLKNSDFVYNHPENVDYPFEEIKSIRINLAKRGIAHKVALVNLMVHKNNFSILKAAQHPNCNSAKYFLNKISEAKN